MAPAPMLAVALAVARLWTAGAVQLRGKSDEKEQFFAYDYAQHGQDWIAGSCSSRSRQSPIDLPPTAPVTGTFSYKYNPLDERFELINNGHAYSADLIGLGYGGLTYENAWYNLMNINVHSLSEHTWGGQHKAAELHLVHKRFDGEALVIVAVPVEGESPVPAQTLPMGGMQPPPMIPTMPVFGPVTGYLQVNATERDEYPAAPAPSMPIPSGFSYAAPPATDPGFNPALQAFLKVEPPPVNMKVQVPVDPNNPIDINSFLSGGLFYEYAGSMTAPPCAETVTWLVRSEPLKGSTRQVHWLSDAVYKTTADFGNWRSVMPLNGRVVTMRQSIMEDLPPTAAPVVPNPGKPQQSDREYRAMKWAKDALTIAKASTDYIRDLDQRLRDAAQAHANALAPQLEPLTVGGQIVVPATAGAPAGAPPLNAMGPPKKGPPQDMDMEKTAETMARALAGAAKQEIEEASQQISEQAKKAAIEAAKEAANMVENGQGNMLAMANSAGTPPPPQPVPPMGPPR